VCIFHSPLLYPNEMHFSYAKYPFLCSAPHSPLLARAIIKTMTMTTGEFDFDSIFRQAPNGESDTEQEIPFLPVSFTLWIIFVIIMPILLINMLVR